MKIITILQDLLFGSEILFWPYGIINKPTVECGLFSSFISSLWFLISGPCVRIYNLYFVFSDSTLGGFPSCLRRCEHLWNFSFEGRRHENCRLFGIQVYKKVCFLTFGNMRKCINHYDNSIPKKLFFFWLMFRREQ